MSKVSHGTCSYDIYIYIYIYIYLCVCVCVCVCVASSSPYPNEKYLVRTDVLHTDNGTK